MDTSEARLDTSTAKLSVLADDANICGEAPIWDAQTDCLWWSDCDGSKFFRYDWRSARHELVKEGVQVNGCVLNEPGGFVITNNSGVWLWDASSQPRLVAAEADGFPCQLNDCIADPKGRLITGSWFFETGKEPQPIAKLFCVETNGRVRVLDEGFYLSNGLGFSLDKRTLYFADSIARSVFAYDYDTECGQVSNRRVFVQFRKESGVPDGLTVDGEDFVWIAEWYGSQIVRYDPDGKLERRLNSPAKQTSSLIFGGPDLTDICITSAGVYQEPIPLMPPGYDVESGYRGGALYHINLGIQGKPDFKTNIGLSV